jgi:hypothetical protein
MKSIQRLHLVKLYKTLKTGPTGTKAGIPLMHQPMDLLGKDLPGLLLELLCHHGLNLINSLLVLS